MQKLKYNSLLSTKSKNGKMGIATPYLESEMCYNSDIPSLTGCGNDGQEPCKWRAQCANGQNPCDPRMMTNRKNAGEYIPKYGIDPGNFCIVFLAVSC